MNAVLIAEPLAKTGEAAKSGPIGLAVIILLCLACYFLFKSMSKHLRRVREDFPDPDRDVRQPARPVRLDKNDAGAQGPDQQPRTDDPVEPRSRTEP